MSLSRELELKDFLPSKQHSNVLFSLLVEYAGDLHRIYTLHSFGGSMLRTGHRIGVDILVRPL